LRTRRQPFYGGFHQQRKSLESLRLIMSVMQHSAAKSRRESVAGSRNTCCPPAEPSGTRACPGPRGAARGIRRSVFALATHRKRRGRQADPTGSDNHGQSTITSARGRKAPLITSCARRPGSADP
jgi:hypothetical protein